MKNLLSVLCILSSVLCAPLVAQIGNLSGTTEVKDKLLLPSKADPGTPTALEVWISTTNAGIVKYRYSGTTYNLLTTAAAAAAYQPLDPTLTALAGVTTAADKLIYANGSDTFATTDFTSTARSLLDDNSTSAMRTTLGLAIGTDVQAYNANLAAIAGLTTAADKLTYWTGSGTASTTDLTAFGRAQLGITSLTSTALLLGGGSGAISASDITYSASILTVPAGFTISTAGTGTTIITQAGATALPAPQANFTYQLGPFGEIVGVATTPFVQFRRLQGTAASPTAVQSGNTLGNIGAKGYMATALSGSVANFAFVANENFTDSANGTRWDLGTTANGATSALTRLSVQSYGKIAHTPGTGSQAAWSTTGALFSQSAATITDSSSSGTVSATTVFNSFGIPVLNSTSSTTFSGSLVNVYIAGDPTVTGNASLSGTSYGLFNEGKTRLVGALTVNGTSTFGALLTVAYTSATSSVFDVQNTNTGTSKAAGLGFNDSVGRRWLLTLDPLQTGTLDFGLLRGSGRALRLQDGSYPSSNFLIDVTTTALKLDSSLTAGLQLYNTADQTTNYERLNAFWSGNIGYYGFTYAGTGAARAIKIGVGSVNVATPTTRSVQIQNAFPLFDFDLGATTSLSTQGNWMRLIGTSTATTGTGAVLAITPTYNQSSGTAANTDLLINRTETAVGSGTQNLADFQVGGTTRFSFGNQGLFTIAANGGRMIGAQSIGNSASTSSRILFDYSTFTASSGTQVMLQLSATYNQTGTAGGTDLLINRTETAVGSGTHRFATFQVSGAEKFGVDNLGRVAIAGATLSASTALITPAGTTSVSSLRIPHGSAPSAPVDGDIWTTTTGVFARVNGSTVQLN